MWDLATRDKEGLVIQQLVQSGLSINVRLPLKPCDSFKPRVFSYFGNVKFSRHASAVTAVALYKNPIACADILLKAGAEVNYSSAYKLPPLLPALDHRSYGLAELLIAYGSSVNVYHPLVIGNIAVVISIPWWKGLSMLLKCGSEVESLFKFHKSVYNPHIIGTEGTGLEEDEMTEPESSDDESEPPVSPSKRRKPARHAPLTLYHTLRAASYLMKSNDVTAGKVLYRLLQFSANVLLSPDLESLLDSKEEWKGLMVLVESPRSLKHYCRWVIRRCLGSQNLLKIDPVQDLKLPPVLLEYVMYTDLD